MPTTIDRLRDVSHHCRNGAALPPDLAGWLAAGIERFLGRQAKDLDGALGLIQAQGGFRGGARTRSAAAIASQSLAGRLPQCGRDRAARRVAEMLRRYATGLAPRPRILRHAAEYEGTPHVHLWAAFKSGGAMPSARRSARSSETEEARVGAHFTPLRDSSTARPPQARRTPAQGDNASKSGRLNALPSSQTDTLRVALREREGSLCSVKQRRCTPPELSSIQPWRTHDHRTLRTPRLAALRRGAPRRVRTRSRTPGPHLSQRDPELLASTDTSRAARQPTEARRTKRGARFMMPRMSSRG